MWENIIIVGQLAAMLTTAGVALGAVRYVNRKTKAEAVKAEAEGSESEALAAKTLTDLALTLVEPLNLRIKALEAEVHRLAEKVEQYGYVSVVVAGTVTQICVEETARQAFHHGYRTTVLSDCVSSFDSAMHAATLKNLNMKFGVVMDSKDYLELVGN